jgi:hypothetical protein
MKRKLGKRAYDRFVIHGAFISWMSAEGKSFPDETWPLSDISTAGLSFLTNNAPIVGSEISLLIILPTTIESFELLGRVIYSISRGPGLTYGYRVGVKFKEFGESEGCNSLQSLNLIKTLEGTYGRGNKS